MDGTGSLTLTGGKISNNYKGIRNDGGALNLSGGIEVKDNDIYDIQLTGNGKFIMVTSTLINTTPIYNISWQKAPPKRTKRLGLD